MDVSKLNAGANPGAAMELKSPADGKPLQDKGKIVTMTVLSADHPAVRDAVSRHLSDAMQDRGRDAVAEAEAGQIAQAAACVTDWAHLEYLGAEFPCTHANRIKLMTEQVWIREQVLTYSARRANFISGTPKP